MGYGLSVNGSMSSFIKEGDVKMQYFTAPLCFELNSNMLMLTGLILILHII